MNKTFLVGVIAGALVALSIRPILWYMAVVGQYLAQ